MKIDLDQIQMTLLENKIPQETVVKVINDLKTAKEEEKAHSQPAPKTKNEFGVIISDSENILQGKDLVAWVFQMPTGDDMGTVLTRVSEIAKNHNENTRAGKKNKVTTVGECFEFVKRRFWKESRLTSKTKIPVRVLVTANKL